MRYAPNEKDEEPVSEMAIVNTFTKLIFGDEAFSERELTIIEAFRQVDVNVLRDSHLEMGGYLRNLGVREMIQLVTRLHGHITRSMENLPLKGKQQSRAGALVQGRVNRGTH